MTVTPFPGPSTTREETLAATYRALCKHGYTDPTLAVIGDELKNSKSLVYHHYEGKDDLVPARLEFILDYVERRSNGSGSVADDPRNRACFATPIRIGLPSGSSAFYRG